MISDRVVRRLREVAEMPDLTGVPYTIVRPIGRGGMGMVYEAEDQRLDRRVALKVALTSLPEGAARRLLDEAKLVARLEHPGIVPVFDAGELTDGRLFYAMKLVRGFRLDEWTASKPGIAECLRLFVRICEPVAYAHAHGIVHRDLSPANVMVGEFGSVLVMDWGVAAVLGADAAVIAGTPGFMAPEVEEGRASNARADVYSLGNLLLFVLGDRRLPRRLAAIVARATDRDAERRYPTAESLALDVERYLDGEPVEACPENVFQRAGRWASRNRVVLALVAAYLVMRLIVYLWVAL